MSDAQCERSIITTLFISPTHDHQYKNASNITDNGGGLELSLRHFLQESP